MSTKPSSRLTGLALKIVTIAAAVAAVYVTDTLPDRAHAQAAPTVATTTPPRVAIAQAGEAWAADESAEGARPDASH